VANNVGNVVSVIDTATNTVTAAIIIGLTPELRANNSEGVAVSPDGSKLYVTNSNGDSVSIIDTATNKIINTWYVGREPKGIAVAPDGTVFVTISGAHTVSVFGTVSGAVAVGNDPTGVAVNPVGTKAYVTNSVDGTVSVIDTSNNTVTATVSVGNWPWGVAVTPDGKKVYVANEESNTIPIIDTATNTVVATMGAGGLPIAFGNFIGPLPSSTPILPVANFNSNATEGSVPLDVQFTDLSTNATDLQWNFGDGSSNVSVPNPEHIFTSIGSFNVVLTASNANGSDSKSMAINVQKATPTITWSNPATVLH
jgi:YVTN family beta-propeller protein